MKKTYRCFAIRETGKLEEEGNYRCEELIDYWSNKSQEYWDRIIEQLADDPVSRWYPVEIEYEVESDS